MLELKTIRIYGDYITGYVKDGVFYCTNGKIAVNYKSDMTTFRPDEKMKLLIEETNRKKNE